MKQSATECKKDGFLSKNNLSFAVGIEIPNSCYFMIGDNPFESMDSRFWGFIHEDQINGKVVAIF